MNAEEIVKELRSLSCDWQSVSTQPEMDWAVTTQFAADLIESLQAQLAESQRREMAAGK